MQNATPVPFRSQPRSRTRPRGARFDNLGQVPPDRSLKGTNDWTQAEIVAAEAAEAATLAFGVVLVGDGVLWADGLSFEALPA